MGLPLFFTFRFLSAFIFVGPLKVFSMIRSLISKLKIFYYLIFFCQ